MCSILPHDQHLLKLNLRICAVVKEIRFILNNSYHPYMVQARARFYTCNRDDLTNDKDSIREMSTCASMHKIVLNTLLITCPILIYGPSIEVKFDNML